MNYVKSCLIITMLLGVQIGYSQCNESNWQEYYPNMANCGLAYANLSYTYLTQTDCFGVFFVLANLEDTIFDGANLTYAYFDETGNCIMDNSFGCDYYDDTSYDAGATSGDLNLDGVDDILDVVTLVNN